MADKDIAHVINIEDFINMHGEKDLSTNNTNKYSWRDYFDNEIVNFFYDLKRTKEEYKKSSVTTNTWKDQGPGKCCGRI